MRTHNVEAWPPYTVTIRDGRIKARTTCGAELIGRVRIIKTSHVIELNVPANPLEPYTLHVTRLRSSVLIDLKSPFAG
jgi:hypothetical protein